MSRPRRAPTVEYIDEECGHVPILHGPPPRVRRRHGREHVRAQRQRSVQRAMRRVDSWRWHDRANREQWDGVPLGAACSADARVVCIRMLSVDRTPQGWSTGAYRRQWSHGRNAARPCDRRLRDADQADEQAAFPHPLFDGPDSHGIDEDEEHDRLCCWLETGQTQRRYSTEATDAQ